MIYLSVPWVNGKGFHTPNECWTLHPEKAPKHLIPKALPDNNRKEGSTSQELVLHNNHIQTNTAQVNLTTTQVKDPKWFLDTGHLNLSNATQHCIHALIVA